MIHGRGRLRPSTFTGTAGKAPAIALLVNGHKYTGWKTARVTRGIESVAGSFDLSVSDRDWAIEAEDECTVMIGDVGLINGWVDEPNPHYSAGDSGLNVAGRDATGALVDCSAILESWEFKGVSVLAFAKKVCEPFGIAVSLQSGLTLPASPKKISVDPGDTAFSATSPSIHAAARTAVTVCRSSPAACRAFRRR